jgi:hypothetical protein
LLRFWFWDVYRRLNEGTRFSNEIPAKLLELDRFPNSI